MQVHTNMLQPKKTVSLDKKRLLSSGFTIVELLVAITITAILATVIVSLIVTVTVQYGVSSTRNNMATSLSTALNRIDSDVRYAHTALAQHTAIDAAAPISTGGKWQTTEDQLVLATTARKQNGTSATGAYPGAYDNIVYYLNNQTLYRRLIAANVDGNRHTTTPCGPTNTGGCPSDVQIARNVRDFVITMQDDTGTTSSVSQATRVTISLTLEQTSSGQTIAVDSQSTTSFYSDAPASQNQTLPSLAAGPGGMDVSSTSTIYNSSMTIIGQLFLKDGSSAGNNLDTIQIGNVGCGTISSFPIACTTSPVQSLGGTGNVVVGNVCSNYTPVSGPGVTISGNVTLDCNTLDSTLPKIDKKAILDTIPAGSIGSSGCPSATNVTIAQSLIFENNVSTNAMCLITITANNVVLHFKGDLTINPYSSITVANNVTTRPIIITDGRLTIANTSNSVVPASVVANSGGISPIFISFYSTNAACSSSPTCTSHQSTSDLYTSAVTSTTPDAITLSNTTAAGSYYAYFGKLKTVKSTIDGSLAGQKISLTDQSQVTLTGALPLPLR